ncbi:hypothetical protein GCM10009654_19720 [Streptomyces hebeiensis]|uniref:Uncharacterized protein n=1 Tax=Streptomyces hebeiensis TaxID=229486 RepID=A0ABN1URL2_9ACTN
MRRHGVLPPRSPKPIDRPSPPGSGPLQILSGRRRGRRKDPDNAAAGGARRPVDRAHAAGGASRGRLRSVNSRDSDVCTASSPAERDPHMACSRGVRTVAANATTVNG